MYHADMLNLYMFEMSLLWKTNQNAVNEYAFIANFCGWQANATQMGPLNLPH